VDELVLKDVYTNTAVQVPFVAFCDELAKSAGTLIPACYKSGASVMASILTGRELGFSPMQSLRMLFPINGVVGIYAQAMEALLEKHGIGREIVEWTTEKCAIKFTRNGREMTFDYTMEEAKQSGDAAKNPSYQKRPKDMLYARCMARGARKIAADVLGGLYTEDEREAIQVMPTTTGGVAVTATIVGDGEPAAHDGTTDRDAFRQLSTAPKSEGGK